MYMRNVFKADFFNLFMLARLLLLVMLLLLNLSLMASKDQVDFQITVTKFPTRRTVQISDITTSDRCEIQIFVVAKMPERSHVKTTSHLTRNGVIASHLKCN